MHLINHIVLQEESMRLINNMRQIVYGTIDAVNFCKDYKHSSAMLKMPKVHRDDVFIHCFEANSQKFSCTKITASTCSIMDTADLTLILVLHIMGKL